MAYRLLREFRQASTRLDTPPFSNRRHPFSSIARDPSLRNRIDHEAAAMSTPADPQAVLDAIKDSHEDLVLADHAEPA